MAAQNANRQCSSPCIGPQVTTPRSGADVLCGSDNPCWIPGVVMLRGWGTGANAILQERSSRCGRHLLAYASVLTWHATARAAIAQLGEHQAEDLKVPGSIPGLDNA